MSDTVETQVTLKNKKGLHARAAAKFVKVVAQFDAQVTVSKIAGAGVVAGAAHAEASGASILGLMMLGAEVGSTLGLIARGPQAAELVAGITKLIDERFGEE